MHLGELDVLIETLGSTPVGRAYCAPWLALGLPVLGEAATSGAAAGGASPAGATSRHTILLKARLLTTKLIIFFNLIVVKKTKQNMSETCKAYIKMILQTIKL